MNTPAPLSSFFNIPEKPCQPDSSYDFPVNKLGRKFMSEWFKKWRWLHYDCANDLAFCHTCVRILQLGLYRTSRKLSLCTTKGFSNWSRGTHTFNAHEESELHVLSTYASALIKVNQEIQRIDSICVQEETHKVIVSIKLL